MPTLFPYRMEFHIARLVRDKYQFEEALFSLSGNVIFANFHAARLFAQKMNARRDLIHFPEQAMQAGQINAMGMIDEIMHMVVSMYHKQRSPEAIADALAFLKERIGDEEVEQTLLRFVEQFPPLLVYQRQATPREYLDGESINADGKQISNQELVLEELLMLWLANANPAFAPFLELFDDQDLKKTTAYPTMISGLKEFFDTQPTFGPDGQNLIDMLRSPAIQIPYSLEGQLEYIRTRWLEILGSYLYRLLSSLDLIKEENKIIFPGGGPGPIRVYDFRGQEGEAENFSPDKDWMPNLILIAKNSYVWLDQLSKKYKYAITRLDEIPDEELDNLSCWGFTGLWLIGLWERSQASQRIKIMRGNPDAVASAYSLYSYDIAWDLGGEDAYRNLRDRAWKRGIRLSSDMVPNHMGIDSRWVIEHPDWFVSLPYSPFPSYNFGGENLSGQDGVGIYLEDHYFDNTDAAVVFKRVDFNSGDTRFIYHGNDGTSMPWNDTAQLNYLLPQVREAVIQTILHVARKFPVIRFDAAMTLAKRHYQRLWFPEPGSGGDIASRSDYGMTKEQFNAAFPNEFWREVVDRVAQEVPDTLLLAEAFWLMEGYFVRTLGMHRVYNSAFMNMLRDEKNAEYRQAIKNTLEFEPEILKRYVNFMNNPDERTAVEQYGKGDKYFGICIVMATLPGLPMFGHGQIEGYTEKYGMEFRRAYWDEHPDGYLVERHEREVFPLLRKRYLFAGVENFLLYDFYTPQGYVDENVYAYSNRVGEQRGLVVYQNKFGDTRGWIRTSAAYLDKGSRGLAQKSIGEGLALPNDPDLYVVFRDPIRGLEYIRSSTEIHSNGLFVELDAYQYRVYLDFRVIQDNAWKHYAQLTAYLNDGGVPNIEEALQQIFLQPVHRAYRELINAGSLNWLLAHHSRAEAKFDLTRLQAFAEVETKLGALLGEIRRYTNAPGDVEALASEILSDLKKLLALPGLEKSSAAELQPAADYLLKGRATSPALARFELPVWGALLTWTITRKLGKLLDASPEGYPEQSRSWIDEWMLGKFIRQALQDQGADEGRAEHLTGLVRLLTGQQNWYDPQTPLEGRAFKSLQSLLRDGLVQRYIGENRHQDVLWFNQESFEELLWWLFTIAVVDLAPAVPEPGSKTSPMNKAITELFAVVEALAKAEAESGYQVEKLLAGVAPKAD
ncbi:MAG TPA: alpha-amylase family glycosyl hydrolase [Anaerolineales bacterium]|nr:alpha-amylase family glycosyl hydrolase [Anaerolineales bacterium]